MQIQPGLPDSVLRSLCLATVVHCNERFIDHPGSMVKAHPDDQLYIIVNVDKVRSERGIVESFQRTETGTDRKELCDYGGDIGSIIRHIGDKFAEGARDILSIQSCLDETHTGAVDDGVNGRRPSQAKDLGGGHLHLSFLEGVKLKKIWDGM